LEAEKKSIGFKVEEENSEFFSEGSAF